MTWNTGARYLTRSDITGYFDFQCEQLNDMIPLVRGELTKLERRTLAALTTIDVHNRDVPPPKHIFTGSARACKYHLG